MTARDIQKALKDFTGNHEHQFQNSFIYRWESDFFSVTKSAYAYEFEIKISKSDFKADFEKEKHRLFKAHKRGLCTVPRGIGRAYIDGKYQQEVSHIEVLQVNHKTCPNRFYFVCPTALIDPHEVPAYAGLMYCTTGGGIIEAVKSPYLHKQKFNAKEMLFDKYFWRCDKLTRENMIQKSVIESLNEKLKNLKEEYGIAQR